MILIFFFFFSIQASGFLEYSTQNIWTNLTMLSERCLMPYIRQYKNRPNLYLLLESGILGMCRGYWLEETWG